MGIGETGVGEMGVGETGPNRQNGRLGSVKPGTGHNF